MGQDQEHGGPMAQDGARPDVNERLLRGLAAAQTPRQQEIARSIYSRLNAGDSVEDVEGLIAEMAKVITEERRTSTKEAPRTGRRADDR